MKEKNAEEVIKKIVLARFSGEVIKDELLEELKKMEPDYFWEFMLKETAKHKDKTIKNRKIDIYNLQLIYWTFGEHEISNERKKKFYDSLMLGKIIK